MALLIKNKESHIEQRKHESVLDFFETIGLLVRKNCLDAEMVWGNFGYYAIRWGFVCQTYISKERQIKNNDETIFEDFQFLVEEMYKIEQVKRKKSRSDVTPTEQDIEEFLNDEI